MSIPAAQALVFRTRLNFHRPLIFCLHKVRRSSSIAALDVAPLVDPVLVLKNRSHNTSDVKGDENAPKWKKLSSEELGISTSMIAKPTRVVLNGLKKKGFEVYLVGGCVRDLLLNKTPKDFDIITSAELKEVLKTFQRCEIVGRRFPICHVHVDDTIVEVSSFNTTGRRFRRNSYNVVRRPATCDEADFIRWKNCLGRDFTINGLMFDPFARIVYDYLGGLEDIRRAKVRCVIPASASFVEDCARILRGVRIAGRLGFRFSRETAHFVKELASSISRLDKASYFISQGFRRRDKRSNMLLTLFSTLDNLLAPDRPCHSSLWIAILAFHKALVDRPRDPLVVAAFSVAVHCGGSLSDVLGVARKISQPHDTRFSELLDFRIVESDEALLDEMMDLATYVEAALRKMTDEHFISRALTEYPQAPKSDLVFIPWALSQKVDAIFECVRRGKEKGFRRKRGSKIDYESLALGKLHEIRHIFARVVFDTMFPSHLKD
ncbi:uncharacterized protein LOC107812113 isoform X2 [Nicotiana tabacum]|uniref:Uncharacterized protein LOC107812113 isoform X2 n=1 Tax=Nicotiana tabacum TaxID=4097 RepID=A0A1S4BUR2_TOBAC|nr:uncharacterized protein LOC104099282 isoform X3 [Nicotiana tomentosiformis]XP_016492630.1 PREDICTED: uncharacterized protein LOC107812113 isoform X3 [Nicotiana tabacum]